MTDPSATPATEAAHVIEARGDQYLVPGESIPAEGGGWWTPYVETPWGYFRFAVRPVEQPDGLILFWHDSAGAHSQNVITDLPGDKLVLAELEQLRARVSAPAADGLRAALERIAETAGIESQQAGTAPNGSVVSSSRRYHHDGLPDEPRDGGTRDHDAQAQDRALRRVREACPPRYHGAVHRARPDAHSVRASGLSTPRRVARMTPSTDQNPASRSRRIRFYEWLAGKLLVRSSRLRAARLDPEDVHELRHIWAAINAGNSDHGPDCTLDRLTPPMSYPFAWEPSDAI